MAFIFGVKMETKVHLYMPWQRLQILILSWSQGPWIRENLQASISPQSIKHGTQCDSICISRLDGGELQRMSHTWVGAISFSFGLLFIPFLKAPPHCATISLSLAIHIRKAVPFPFRDPKHFLSLYEGLSGTFSTKQTAKVGIQQRVGRQYVLTFLEAFQRLQRFHFLALVMFRSMMAAITTCLLLPSAQRSRGAL